MQNATCKRYQKLKEAVKHLTIPHSRNQGKPFLILETVETALSQASLAGGGRNSRRANPDRLYQNGAIAKKIHKRKNLRKCLKASDGKTIVLVGRNNLQNDELTFPDR